MPRSWSISTGRRRESLTGLRRRGAVLAAAGLCGFTTSWAWPAPVAAAPSPPAARVDTAPSLQRRGGQPCPDGSEFTCVTIAMPLDHFTPSDTRTIDVVFAVLPASGDRKGAFVTATGGPGYSGVSVADYYTSFFQAPIPRRFDLVFFDQRGLALSGGLTCPEAAAVYYRVDSQTATPAQQRAFKDAARRFSEDCTAEAGRLEVHHGQVVLVVERLDDRRADLTGADHEDLHPARAYSVDQSVDNASEALSAGALRLCCSRMCPFG